MTSIKDLFQPKMRSFHGTEQAREVGPFGRQRAGLPWLLNQYLKLILDGL
jgi:hypothetical protein